MTQTYHHTSTKASRKRRQCDWCGEWIEIGEPYEGYGYRMESGDGGYLTLHPECCEAMVSVATEEGYDMTWDVGEFSRGCGCQRGDCRCGREKE